VLGGPGVDRARCVAILEAGAARGITPSPAPHLRTFLAHTEEGA
jgi:hypothetical protein